MKNIVLGLALNMTWEAIEPWAVSLRRSGYDGDAVLFVLPDAPEDLLASLKEFNIQTEPLGDIEFANKLVPFNRFFPYIGRFLMVYRYLAAHPGYEFAVCTDVRDLVFMHDPMDWLNSFLASSDDLVVAGENILHCDQVGNMQWLDGAFREAKDFLENKEVYCSGIVAGRAPVVRDLALQMYLMGRELSDRVWGVDQPVYNFLMHGAYQRVAFVPSPDGRTYPGWAINLAVVATIGGQSKQLIDQSIFHPYDPTEACDLGLYAPTLGTLDLGNYAIVHQYDRIPPLAEELRRRFKK